MRGVEAAAVHVWRTARCGDQPLGRGVRELQLAKTRGDEPASQQMCLATRRQRREAEIVAMIEQHQRTGGADHTPQLSEKPAHCDAGRVSCHPAHHRDVERSGRTGKNGARHRIGRAPVGSIESQGSGCGAESGVPFLT